MTVKYRREILIRSDGANMMEVATRSRLDASIASKNDHVLSDYRN
jgi:hypothetical protein